MTAIAEIAGCFAFWAWLRLGKSGLAYAAYGGVYVVAPLLWFWAVEGVRPDRWDVIGGAVCLIGMAIILFGPRAVPA